MRLALAAGRPEDVEGLLELLSAREIAEWQAFERIEGFSIGARGDWERTALLASLYVEAHRDPRRRARAVSMREFLPWIERPPSDGGALLKAQLAHRVRPKPKKE